MKTAPLITFEGLDGSGKTTQIDRLVKYLDSRNTPLLRVREPGGTYLGNIMRSILLENGGDMSPMAELFTFLAARAELCAKEIWPAIFEGRIPICDRFFDSSIAYQGYGGGINPMIIYSLCLAATENLVPALTFFIALTPEDCAARNPNKKDRIESRGLEYFNRVYNGYLVWLGDQMLTEKRNIIFLDGRKNEDEIASLVQAHVEQLPFFAKQAAV